MSRQTRPHRDIDIDVDATFEDDVLTALQALGYAIETDWRPNRVELGSTGQLRAIAKCAGCDDVMFGLSDHGWAIVHLSWSRSRPESPPWPQAVRLGSFLAVELAMEQHEH